MIYHFDDYALDENRHELRRAGEAVPIEPRVFQVLLYLIEHRDRVVSKAELFEQCWPDTFVTDSALTRCVTKLRRAVRIPLGATEIIKTVHRQGYRWVADVRVVPPENLAPDPRPATPVEADPVAVVTAASAAPSPMPLESSDVATTTPDRVAPGAEAPAVAERRQLTVLSCTLIGAAQLAAQLEPEDMYDVLHTFHTTCAEIVAPFEGHIAQRLDDGLLIYFGYPQAHEDDAQRAVRSGLALAEAMRQGTIAALTLPGTRLDLRMGIATGMMIVTSGATPDSPPSVGVGNALSLAVRLGALAPPCTVVISEATARLVAGYFECSVLEEARSSEAPEPLRGYEVLSQSPFQTRLEVESTYGLTPFVGREAEVALLEDRWTYVHRIGKCIFWSSEVPMTQG